MKSRACSLLESALKAGELSKGQVARELVVMPETLDRILDGSEPMLPEQQLRLATMLIELVPRLARQGHTLRAQVAATLSFTERETEVHSQAPKTWRSLTRSPSPAYRTRP